MSADLGFFDSAKQLRKREEEIVMENEIRERGGNGGG